MSTHTAVIGRAVVGIRITMNDYAKNVPAEQPSTFTASSYKGKAHALEKVTLFVPDTSSISISSSSALADLEACMHTAAIHSTSSEVVHAALAGLQGLALASGSVQGALRLATSLIAMHDGATKGAELDKAPANVKALPRAHAKLTSATLPDALRAQVPAFVRDFDAGVSEELETLLGMSSSSSSSATPGVLAAFDPETKSSNLTLSDDNTVVTSTSTSKGCVYGTVGISKGKALWEFKVVQDSSGDECLCYGFGTKPKTNDSYDSGNNLYMIRGYNGYVYSRGSQGSSIEKIHKDDLVRFEADMDIGEVRVFINDRDQGIVFRDLVGKEIFPAVCTYSNNRSAKFTRLEIAGVAAATGDAVPLALLSDLASGKKPGESGVDSVGGIPTAVVRTHMASPLCISACMQHVLLSDVQEHDGHYIAGGFLEEADAQPTGTTGTVSAPATIVVAGEARRDGISLRPDHGAKGVSRATFPLVQQAASEGKDSKDKKGGVARPYDFFIGRVGVDDSSPHPGTAAVAPVIMTIALDGKEVWQSEPLSIPGDTRFVRLPLAGAAQITIGARLAPGAAAGSIVARTVWCKAGVVKARDWSFSTRRDGTLPTFADTTEAGEGSLPSTPLALARFVLSRLVYLSEFHTELVRRGQVAATGIARTTGVELTRGPAALVEAAKAYNVSVKGKKDVEPVSAADIALVDALRTLRAPYCLDVNAATFKLLAALLQTVLAHAWLEGAAKDAVSELLDEPAGAAARPWSALARQVLLLIRIHLRRLVAAGIEPATVGILTAEIAPAGDAPASTDARAVSEMSSLLKRAAAELHARGDRASTYARAVSGRTALFGVDAGKRFDAQTASLGVLKESTLAPVHRLLQAIVDESSSAGEDGAAHAVDALSGRYHPSVQSAAADAIDAGLTVLYPTAAERRQLLAGLISRGGTVEVQFKFPAVRRDVPAKPKGKDEKDKKDKSADTPKNARDPRCDRALLLLQLECERLGWPSAMHGRWGDSIHLVFNIRTAGSPVKGSSPAASARAAAHFLDAGMARVFERAGFGKWSIPMGCADPYIPLKIERIGDFSTPSSRALGDGIGIVRVFTRTAGSYEEINAGIQSVAAVTEAEAKAAGAAGAAATPAETDAKAGATKRVRKVVR